MLTIVLGVCLAVSAGAPDPEPRYGRPLTDRGAGWLDLMLWIHEEVYIIRGEVFDGKVFELTDETITVRWRRDAARTFRVSPQLTSDRIPLTWRLGTGHRLRDVCVGDWVTMDLAHARDGYVCVNLGIFRRPGGVIPPAEDTHLPEKFRLHNRCNATQFAEEIFVPKWAPWLLVRFAR